MSAPLVSAVIPVFNRAWSIERAVDSVAGQTWRPLELIVVDDGSTDATPDTLITLQRAVKRTDIPMEIVRQENRGVSAARNAGIACARGDYIALLDSDDEWLPEKTAKQMADLAATGRLINQTDERWVRLGQPVRKPPRYDKAEGDLYAHCLDNCAIGPSTVLMHRRLIDVVGPFDESLPACEDYEMWLRVACRFEVGLVPEPLVVKYGGHPDQLSTTVAALDRYRIQAIAKLLDNASLSEKQKRLALEELRRKCRIYAIGCRKRGRRDEANEILVLPDRYETTR